MLYKELTQLAFVVEDPPAPGPDPAANVDIISRNPTRAWPSYMNRPALSNTDIAAHSSAPAPTANEPGPGPAELAHAQAALQPHD